MFTEILTATFTIGTILFLGSGTLLPLIDISEACRPAKES